MGWLLGLDRAAAWTRPAWGWVGELALLALGLHLAADRLDDALGGWLAGIEVAWPDPEAPLIAGAWLAAALEIAALAWAGRWRLAARAEPVADARAWWARRSAIGAVLPLFWAPVAAAGTWAVAIAVEDAAAAVILGYARPLAWAVGALVGWRFGWTGLETVVRRGSPPERWWAGLPGAVVALPLAWLAARHGLPLWWRR